MTTEQLQQDQLQCQRQLSEARENLKKAEDRYDALLAFGRQCELHEASFSEEIQRRRTRLAPLEQLDGRSKCAEGYFKRMREALRGSEYVNAAGAISQLMDEVDAEKNRARQEIRELEYRVEQLRQRSASLNQKILACAREEANGN